jgi:hypothetical protein
MNIRDALLENKNFVTYTLAGLVEVERDRILSTGLATESQLSSLADVTEYMVKMAKSGNTDVLVNTLANLCTSLKHVQLPGDFEKFAEEEFYIVLDLPYEDEEEVIGMGRGGPPGSGPNPKCPLKEKEEEKEEEEEEEEEEHHKHEHEEECEDCDDTIVAQEVLAESVNNLLIKIANVLGDKGDHEAAYMVERTIRSITREAENGKLFGK